MKKWVRLMLILAVISTFMLVISSCQQSGTKAPEDNDISEGESKDEGKGQEDGSKTSGEDGKAQEGEAGDNVTQGASKDGFEKLDINPGVDIREGSDYIVIDKPSVDFELEDLNGNKVKLSDYRGQIVFLNFWATWCPPCRYEMPDMESIHQQYGDKGVALLAVSSTDPELQWSGKDSKKAEKRVMEFIEKEGYTFSVPLDPDNKVIDEYMAIYPITGIPTTYMIDREGMIRYVRPGAFQGEEQLKAFIALLED